MPADPSAAGAARAAATAAAIVLVAALLGAALVLHAPPTLPMGTNAQPTEGGEVRWLRDDFDLAVYSQRGSFAVRRGARPYVEVPSEYPQLATYLFALPYLIARSPEGYRAAFTCLLALALGALAWVTARLSQLQGGAASRALWLLLPATLYFSLNRFDAVPALLAAAAALCLFRAHLIAAFALLAAAVLTKAYPLLYLPLFARYALQLHGPRALGRGLFAFAAVIALLSLQLVLWSGPGAPLSPLQYQLGRGHNGESLFALLVGVLPVLASGPGRALFTALQLAPALLAAFIGPTTPRAALRWLTAITAAFVLFARFQSPQWVVWITPFALAAAVSPFELALVVALELASYAYFPWIYDTAAPDSAALAAVIALLSALRGLQIVRMVWPEPRAAALEVHG